MYGLNFLSTFTQKNLFKVGTVLTPLKHIQRNVSKKTTSYDLKSQVAKEVVIYNFENPKFFVLLNIFSAIQCVTWSYLGLFLFQSLEKTSEKISERKKFWGKVFELERKYSTALSAITIIFGWSMLIGGCFYSLRSIRKIILHKGGRDVTIVTYGFLPGFNVIKTPLNNISSLAHRAKAKKYIPVKLKNKYFYFLIDVRGEFSNPSLFDFTAGIKRNF